MKKKNNKFKNLLYNIYSFFVGLTLGRTRKNVVLGSWGGMTFSDNSRFLYQYLCDNKKELGLSNVIWATRSKKVFDKLNDNGYTTCLIGTKESKKWHLKSGVHVICNMSSNVLSYEPDIDTRYSCGARKIQLWHGAGIKACGYLTNEGKKISNWKKKLNNSFIYAFFSCGFWKRCFFIAISEENKRIAIYDYGYNPKKVIIGIYPRLCYSPKLFDNEIEIIEKIIGERKEKKIILFLPTFRNDTSSYIPPENIPGFESWLNVNRFYWIKKSHSVDSNSLLANELRSNTNVLTLPSDFDISIIYDYVDMLITDYSSASTDAIFKNLITLEYCPDFDYYKNQDRGFVDDFSKYHVFGLVKNPALLFEEIEKRISIDLKMIPNHNKTREFLFGKAQISMKTFSELVIGLNKKTKGE